MTRSHRPAVFTIAAGTPFVDALAAGVFEVVGSSPDDLAKVRILLPTRRACRSLREAFLRQSRGRPLLLPTMTPLGDVDEDEIILSGADAAFTVPQAISPLRRQLLLSRLILARGDNQTKPDQAVRLAVELARLLDRVHTEGLSFDHLEGLVERGDFSKHWEITLDFLKILTKAWPSILADEGLIDPADRRNRLIDAQARLWRDDPPLAPVIAAGSTGSAPATAELLNVVSYLPKGCVILPGLDRGMDDRSCRAITASHPQFGMVRLLEHIGIGRGDVADWPTSSGDGPGHARLINIALRPADAMDDAMDEPISAAETDGISRIDAPDQQTEAMAIALIMRHCLETPGRTAALLTPDRTLARRVAGELHRWNIDIDDSAGRPLAETPPAVFLRLTAEMVAADLAPVALLGVVKHPLAAAGRSPAGFRSWARGLEKLLLRGPRPGPGMAGLRAAIGETRKRNLENGRNETVARLDTLSSGLDAFDDALKPFARMMNRDSVVVGELLREHIKFAETLAATDIATGDERLWHGDDGEQAALFVGELNDSADVLKYPINTRHYPALLDSLMAGRVVRPRYGRHPRLHIWGNLEARLQHCDIMILGGLNEGSWPPEADPSPWMSRPMLKQFGLAPPERMIGLSAHDFVQALSASRAVVTRPERLSGTPTVASRWLQRLDNLLASRRLDGTLKPDEKWLGWAAGMDMPAGPPTPVDEPRPTPPLGLRPRELPATGIETLIRDPYAVYARRILGLRPLDPIDAVPDARQLGTTVHDILERFIRDHPDRLPDDAWEKLVAIGGDEFSRLMAWPIVRALWWPRFERLAEWFIGWERKRRDGGAITLAAETKGYLDLELAGGRFRLTARADRIDRLKDGSLSIIDYKTGEAPSGPQIESGLSPQLPLEALIAKNGGFDGMAPGEVSELLYLQLSGGRQPGREKRLNFKSAVGKIIDNSREGLARLIGYYDLEGSPYRSRLRVFSHRRDGDYDHLARVKEWGLGGNSDGEAGK